MKKAADRATELGKQSLAALIKNAVEEYATWIKDSGGEFHRRETYGTIDEWVSGNPELSFSKIRRELCRLQGNSVREFNRFYPRARSVYDSARRLALQIRKAIAARKADQS